MLLFHAERSTTCHHSARFEVDADKDDVYTALVSTASARWPEGLELGSNGGGGGGMPPPPALAERSSSKSVRAHDGDIFVVASCCNEPF